MDLMEHQQKAVDQLSNGKILWGGLGRGKTATSLAYYIEKESPRDVFVITTAKKRDSLDWESEAAKFGISTDRELSRGGRLVVDSWNNVQKYTDVEGAFFIFDEQRVVGSGTWVKSFIKIARKNHWILLSATPGDTWMDYAPVFIANSYYRNRTDFLRQHVVYEPFVKFPKIKGYLNETKLELLRNEVLVEMPYFDDNKDRYTNWLDVGYDKEAFDEVWVKRWNPFENQPVRDIAEVFRLARRVVNSDPSRLQQLREVLMPLHKRLIVFYNFDYELDILRGLAEVVKVAEWNGHKKESIPNTREWVYLVQYVSGAEGWNCTIANTICFYSLTYSWKNFEQAKGRIDRLDNHYKKLYYYIFVTNSVTDLAVRRSLLKKEDFNERKFMRNLGQKTAEIL